jgi:PAS domain S-box-containing protein
MSHAHSDDLIMTIPVTGRDVTDTMPATRALRRRRREILAIAAGFVLLGFTCAMAAFLTWQGQSAARAIVEARQAGRAGTLVLQALLSAETSQRGYLLTGDENYLTPYGAAASNFTRGMSELRDRLSGDPVHERLTQEVGRLGTAKFAELDLTLAQVKNRGLDDAVATMRSGRGKVLMDEIHHAVDGLIANADDAIKATTTAQTRISEWLLSAIMVALLFVAGLAVLSLRDSRLRISLLNAREQSLSSLTESLEREVASRTRALAEVNQRFDAALRASGVTVMMQDRDLVYSWISKGEFGWSAADIVGRRQEDAYPGLEQGASLQLKRDVIDSGEPARADVRVAHDGNEIWYDLSVHPLTDRDGTVTGIIAGTIDITRYKEQEARIRLLMREVTHRSKNLLAVTQAIMRQTIANSVSVGDFEARFSARLNSLASSHDLLVQQDWKGASLRELVRSQLGHYIDLAGSQIELEGELLHIQPDAAQHIGMAMHELATNAAKFGALSVPEGRVKVSWHLGGGPDGALLCHIGWVESGGPPVTRPARRGFGRVVSERTVARAVEGTVKVDYAPSGLRWTLTFPATFLAPE